MSWVNTCVAGARLDFVDQWRVYLAPALTENAIPSFWRTCTRLRREFRTVSSNHSRGGGGAQAAAPVGCNSVLGLRAAPSRLGLHRKPQGHTILISNYLTCHPSVLRRRAGCTEGHGERGRIFDTCLPHCSFAACGTCNNERRGSERRDSERRSWARRGIDSPYVRIDGTTSHLICLTDGPSLLQTASHLVEAEYLFRGPHKCGRIPNFVASARIWSPQMW